MNSPLSELMGAAHRTPETSRASTPAMKPSSYQISLLHHTIGMRRALAGMVAECARADAQAAREIQRTFIHPHIVPCVRRALTAQAGHKAEGETC